MSHTITNRCIQCDSCLPQCPTGAIKLEGGDYWIDPKLCNDCQGYYEEPQCVVLCPVNSPVPYQAKKGRCKSNLRMDVSPSLFVDGKSNPFASAIVVWELCNILSQRQSVAWETDINGHLIYQRQLSQGRGAITFRLLDIIDSDAPMILERATGLELLESLDIRAACLHLIYAAHITALESPWEQEFTITDQQIEEYLGLEKRKDLSKITKLSLIRELALQPCQVQVDIHWNQQGKVSGISIAESRLWHMVDIQHHFQEDHLGCKHLTGLTFKVRAGQWARYFLNKQGYKEHTAFYQYGNLPRSLLSTVMSIWQQHEGAARMMLWLLFKTKMGKEQRITVSTLMRVAYGEEKVSQAAAQREGRKRLIRTFESDLEVLNYYGLKPIFDPITYPVEIQPLWSKLSEIPDDAEAALEFWTKDGSNDTRLTDAAPRGKWNRLMNARFLCFELPKDWEPRPSRSDRKRQQRRSNRKSVTKATITLSGEQIIAARKNLQLSQRSLADQIGKSQSWIRDIESGRLQPSLKDQSLLRKVLGLN